MIRISPGLFRGARRFAFLISLALMLSSCSLFGNGNKAEDLPLVDYAAAGLKDVADGGTLTLGASFMPLNLNPFHTDGVDNDASRILEPTMGSAVRVLADGSWEVDKNYAKSVSVLDRKPLVIEVSLNADAVWEDGTPIASRDMVAFVKAMKNPRLSSSGHPAFSDIESVEVISDLVYHVRFKRMNADWPAVIYPQLPASVTTSRKAFNTQFSGKAVPSNGPFRVTSVSTETSAIRLEPNPLWWGPKPALDAIVWRFATPEVLAQAFELDELDVAPLMTVEKKSLPDSATLRVSASNSWSQLTLNGGRGPLENPKVRKAVGLALDREAFAQDLAKDFDRPGGVIDTVVTMPGQFGHRAVGTERDIKKAKDLLSQAGWKNSSGKAMKGGQQLKLVLPIPEKNDASAHRAKLITEQLKEIGIAVKTDVVAADTFYEKRVIPMDFDLVTFTRRGSAFNVAKSRLWFTPRDSPQNFTGKASNETRLAFAKALAEIDPDDRADANEKLEKAAAKQGSIFPLVVIPSAWMVRDGVVNYGPTQFEETDWVTVGWHKESQEK